MIPPFSIPDHLQVVEPATGGRTLRARDLLRDRSVALKWAPTRLQVQGLRREWTYLASLSSRFVPEPLELVLVDERAAFMTVGWIEGQPIDRFLSSAEAADQVAGVMDALAGLDHLHRAGLCHRDIRIRNLLITRGASGPEARWLDLEHSVTDGSLDSGSSYVAGRPPGSDHGGDVFNTQHDIESFCALLNEVLEQVDDGAAVRVLKAFAQRGANVFYLDEMPHARAAWTILREMFEEAGLRVPTHVSLLGNPGFVTHSAAARQWRTLMAEWEKANDGRIVFVHGAPGIGKRRFLTHAAANLAADGACVTNLLGATRPDLSRLFVRPLQFSRGLAPGTTRHIVLVEAGAVSDEIIANQLAQTASPLLIVVAGESRQLSVFEKSRTAGATCVEWQFESFSARDWYRWIRASA